MRKNLFVIPRGRKGVEGKHTDTPTLKILRNSKLWVCVCVGEEYEKRLSTFEWEKSAVCSLRSGGYEKDSRKKNETVISGVMCVCACMCGGARAGSEDEATTLNAG